MMTENEFLVNKKQTNKQKQKQNDMKIKVNSYF